MKGFKAEFKAGRIPENKSPDHNELRKPACDITFNIQIRLKSNSMKLTRSDFDKDFNQQLTIIN